MSDYPMTRIVPAAGPAPARGFVRQADGAPEQRPGQPRVASLGVHPKWLRADVTAPEVEVENEDEVRFGAFMQLLRTAGALDRAATDTLAELDLTAGAFGALLELAENHPVGIAPSELARRLSVARRTATLYVDILSRHGWAERNAHPDDRRMVLARLTEEGLRLVAEVSESYQRRLASLLGDLSPMQAERLQQLLVAVNVTGRPTPVIVDND
jgi:DNA-binding MarR family transcriptional regulator